MSPASQPGGSRCPWSEGSDAYRCYHDTEWGVPVHDDRVLFEFLVLEGAQAGLSWSTILNKREGYRSAFVGFDPATVARFSSRRIYALVANEAIVRHRGKIESAVVNARALVAVQREFGSFSAYAWGLVGGAPRVNRFASMAEVPARTAQSEAMSKDLRRRGFGFVGPTTVYAFMQAVGMVNDHLTSCPRWAQLGGRGRGYSDSAASVRDRKSRR